MEVSSLPQAPAALSTAEERPVSIVQKAMHIESVWILLGREKPFFSP